MSVFQVFTTVLLIFGEFSSADDEGTRLAAAREAFGKINNGCYTFQYARTCYCLTCSTQSMDVQVINDVVEQVSFAEDNVFALDSFCGGNVDAFNRQLEYSSRTIDDLFDLIQGFIDESTTFTVEYHDKIGIPLKISADPVPGAIDDEYALSINCIIFNQKCKSKKEKNRKIKKFNKKDSYSCSNIPQPDQCPVSDQNLVNKIGFECNRYYDGCNTCSCDGADVISCTKRVCTSYADGRCFDCESNTQWSECGNVCDPVCDSPDNICGIRFVTDPGCGEPRCQCPSYFPRWDGNECITEEECSPPPIIGEPFCADIQNCQKATDGCMTCSCDLDGNALECDNPVDCKPGFSVKKTCLKCEDEDTMTYTTCGGCTQTCDAFLADKVFPCMAMCQDKCECNKDTPLYIPSEGRCVSEDECKSIGNKPTTNAPINVNTCPVHCVNYFDGCNDCMCFDNGSGPGACTRKFCPQPVEPTCERCEDDKTMEYTTCGGCDITCNNLNPMCSKECKVKCQCKQDTPIYDPINQKCITVDECPIEDSSTETPINVPVCPAHCDSFFDGCNNCTCNDDGQAVCTYKFCAEPEQPTCRKCEDEETMEFTTCGGCDKTCNNPNPMCTKECKVKCQCKIDTPIYDPVNQKCITYDECNNQEAMLVYGNTNNSNDLLFVLLFVIVIIIFGVYMFNKFRRKGGYQKINADSSTPASTNLPL